MHLSALLLQTRRLCPVAFASLATTLPLVNVLNCVIKTKKPVTRHRYRFTRSKE
jgi:hypothetical protein